VDVFLLVSWIINILPDKYFKTVFEWLSLTWQFASITSRTWRFLNINISQGSVAIHLRCGGIFKYTFVANFLRSLTVKEFWKSVNIWGSYAWEFMSCFLTHSVYHYKLCWRCECAKMFPWCFCFSGLSLCLPCLGLGVACLGPGLASRCSQLSLPRPRQFCLGPMFASKKMPRLNQCKGFCRILVTGVNAPLPPEAKKILKIWLRNGAFCSISE